MKFSELGLSAELLQAVADSGYETPTPVQEQAIPLILDGRDVLARAQTGTGKTAAFTLPLLQRLSTHANTSFSPARHPVRALILAPTRELAAQVEESVRVYGKHLALRPAAIFGGVDIDPQLDALRKGVEILVATPGRLLDHVQQKSVNLGTTQILVLDEADRMLDMGFMPDIRRILSLLPAQRQNLLFSATFPDEVKKLADSILQNPARIQIAKRDSAAELVEQEVYCLPKQAKRACLETLIADQCPNGQLLVFVNTKQGAGRLARELARDGLVATAIHSDRSQAERLQALADFKIGNVQVLVATDIAARGLDIEELPFVINYDLPFAAEDYIHRIGRTGRAGSTGRAISLVAPEEERLLADIERLLKRSLPRQAPPRPAREPSPAPPSMPEPPRAPAGADSVMSALLHKGVKSQADGASGAPYVRTQHPPRQKQREIPALLGGLKKTSNTA